MRRVRDLALPLAPQRAFRLRSPQRLHAAKLHTLQVNIGLRCNLACSHCHVDSSPQRIGDSENMSAATADRLLAWIAEHPQITTIDFTGGSPEMNPQFRRLVRELHGMKRRMIDRCNPTLIPHVDRRTGEAYDWVPAFLAEHRVEVTASLPCYLPDNVEKQRGRGAYNASIDGLQRLNAAGYGSDPHLPLNLVFNPVGPGLPPPQETLEADYKRHLLEAFGIRFTRLLTITNMPIKRFRRDLERSGRLEPYLDLLADAYNPQTLDGLMCRHQIHVDSQGDLSDCDFNRALSMDALTTSGRRTRKLWDHTLTELEHRPVHTADHCYACTAGAGSSCGGALV